MIALALDFILCATMLMLLVLAVRQPVAQLFGAEWAYALWLLPLIVPFLPDLPSLSPTPAFTVLLPPVGGSAAPAVAAESASGEWLLLLLALWGGGAACFAIWQQSTYSAFMLHLGPQGRTAVPASFGGIKVVESDAVEGPVAVGIFKRRIVVPLDFATRYTAAEQRLALQHELVHHRRFDLIWNWIALGMLTLNWFNPIAHFAFRAFRGDQELACDAVVTRSAPCERHDYACALVKSASHPGLIAVCPLNHADFLKRRLKMMKQHRASLARTLGGATSIAIAAAAGLALTTPVFAQPEGGEADMTVVSAARADPLISKADIARLREKCGGDEGRGSTTIRCSDEEARDPEVRAIMDRTAKRVERHVEKAVDAAKIGETLAKATAALDQAQVQRDVAIAHRTQRDVQESMARLNAPEHREQIRESMRRAHEQLARVDMGRHEAEIGQALAKAQVQLANIDVEAITRDALRSVEVGMRSVRIRLSPEERAELNRDIAEARAEALADAAEARGEALREAADARREAWRDAADARREIQQEMRELQRELAELPVLPAPSRGLRSPAPPPPPAPVR